MFDTMILYAVLAISLLAVWLFHPVLFALLDAAMSLWDVAMARDARSKATGAPVPLADDMGAFRMEVAPNETGTTRVVPKPIHASTRLGIRLWAISDAKNDAARWLRRRRH